MYSTCLFCHTDLAANEAIEHFPIGRRLAFDAAKGRLWVVCRKCERWNLTPVEERWEAIEECERAYRATKLRVSTDHIGLARIGEGLELVRIGQPQRPEFAAWRYGDQFGRRRRREAVKIGAIVAAGAAVVPFGGFIGASLGIGGSNAFNIANFALTLYRRNRIVARVTGEGGQPLVVRHHHVLDAMLLPATQNRPWGLKLGHSVGRDPAKPWWKYDSKTDVAFIRGDEAVRVAGQILPSANYKGASRRRVKAAISIIEETTDPHILFREAAKVADRRSWVHPDRKRGTLQLVPDEVLLALEMVTHEESERRAMEGELAVLEEAWREAEEIAGISDNLFLPEAITAKIEELKRAAPDRS